MTEQERQRLSALLDAELPHAEIRGEIRKLSLSDSSRGSWQRYHLIGDAMRQELGPVVDANLANRISKQLEGEPVVLAPAAIKRSANRWFKPAAGMAIAASVAMLVITVAPRVVNIESADQPTIPMANVEPPAERVYVAEDGTRWELLYKPKVESRLNSYLVNHQEYAPAGNMKGIMPYAKFVSYDGNQ
ncbi:MAG: sigma-E factor negative regulatory protein [Gammaproteobacteria bacterium]|nr:sigma-E factor negative regulatory protein [Gammaproteobacteria bacterium]